jgi:hypothetical protein
MANFCSYPDQKRISEITLPNSMDAGAKDVVVGLWGYLDFEGKALHILAPPYVSVRKGQTADKVQWYSLSSYHPGSWTIEAITEGGTTWDSLVVRVKAKQAAPESHDGKKYTDNPNEVPTRTTTPTARSVVSMLLQVWPELTQTGARTLAAQFMAETGGGKYCFNWNLGNVKAGASEPHMYLNGVWEVDSPAGAQSQLARANGMAHIATAEEITKKGWGCPAGKSIIVFDPPHPQCRFRAYSSLEDGAQRWLGHHQRIARANQDFLPALNRGDIPAVAHALKLAGYYTAGESDYARAMTRAKQDIDRSMGAE